MSEDVHPSALTPGATVGEFTVERLLGQGAFAFTYLVTNSLGQRRALKEFFPEGLGVSRASDGAIVAPSRKAADQFDRLRRDFRSEAEIVAGLRHPNVVEVLGFVEANDTSYYAMQYYEGLPFDRILFESGPFTPETARKYFNALLEGLDYIHGNQVFHRDIKPANIFLNAERDEPILLDFGAAKLAASEGTEMNSRLIGTDNYRAKEQMSDRGEIGPWTDIYGLSATFYRMISGELPADVGLRQDIALEGGEDPLKSLKKDPQVAARFDPAFLHALDIGMNLRRQDRPQSVSEWREFLSRPAPTGEAGGGAGRGGGPAPGPQAPGRGPSPTDGGLGRFEEDEGEGTPWARYALAALAVGAIGGGGACASHPALWRGGGVGVLRHAPAPAAPDPADAAAAPAPEPTLSEPEAWVAALQGDTLESYQRYLEQYPDGPNAVKARVEVDKYEAEAWSEAQSRDTVAGYEDYLAKFPSSGRADQARARIEEIQRAEEIARERAERLRREEAGDWQAAAAANTIDAYRGYLNKHAGGANASEAQRRLAALEAEKADEDAWRTAVSLNSKRAFETYQQAFPQGRHVVEAMQKIDELTPKPGQRFRDCASCPEMVILPTGSFTQGGPPDDPNAKSNEQPVRSVSFNSYFAMGVTEVTFNEYQACVDAGGCTPSGGDGGWGRGNRPVINVTWNDARKYASWLSNTTGESYNLPSESQWEYAARAGETRPWPGGSPAAICAVGNGADASSGVPWANGACTDPVGDRTMPVGALAANPFQLKDMIGNVGEWTLDCNTISYRNAPNDGSADSSGSCNQNVVRGGSWFSGPNELRYSARLMQRSQDKNDLTGFRVVRAVEG